MGRGRSTGLSLTTPCPAAGRAGRRRGASRRPRPSARGGAARRAGRRPRGRGTARGVISPAVPHSVHHELARQLVRARPDGVAVAEPDEPPFRLEEPRELRVLDLRRAEARRGERRARARRPPPPALRARRRRPGSRPIAPRRSTGSSGSTAAAHGSAAAARRAARPGSSGDSSARAREPLGDEAPRSPRASVRERPAVRRRPRRAPPRAPPVEQAARGERLDPRRARRRCADDRGRVARARAAGRVPRRGRRGGAGSRTTAPPTVVSRAQDDAVAARGDNGRREAQLRVHARPTRTTRAGIRARAVVHRDARAVRDRRQLLELDIEPVRGGKAPGVTSASPRCERRAARHREG